MILKVRVKNNRAFTERKKNKTLIISFLRDVEMRDRKGEIPDIFLLHEESLFFSL